MPKLRNIALEKARNGEMTFNDTQGHYNCYYYIGRIRVSLAINGLFSEHGEYYLHMTLK